MSYIGKGTLDPSSTAAPLGPKTGYIRNTLLSTQYKYVAEGLLTVLKTKLPLIGSVYTDGFPVMDAYIEPRGDGGSGEMTILTENRFGGAIIEVDWQQIQKPLESHPRYRSGGAAPLNSTDQIQIAQWRATGTPLFASLSSHAKDFATKILAGETAYLVAAPIARQITNYYILLTVGANLGTFSTVTPFGGCPGGYMWLKVTDRGRKDSAYWERTEEWLGADYWDTDLYS
jgi:hypothetical protein